MSNHLSLLKNTFGKGVLPHQAAWICDLPGRNLIMSAKKLAQRLPLKPSDCVLELGPGTGHYSLEVAKRIPKGMIHLLDIQPEMLEKSATRLKKAGVNNFEINVSDGVEFPYEDNTFDVLFMVTVFGEISDQENVLNNAKRVLKPNGILSISEHHPDPDFESLKTVKTKLENAGFILSQTLGFRYAFTANFVAEG